MLERCINHQSHGKIGLDNGELDQDGLDDFRKHFTV
jgi:hypothetical protein